MIMTEKSFRPAVPDFLNSNNQLKTWLLIQVKISNLLFKNHYDQLTGGNPF